jgi:uncharacterized protein (DUF2249 family)
MSNRIVSLDDGRRSFNQQPEQNTIMNTSTETLFGADRVMDVRPIPCSVKHGLIIKQWLDLAIGEHFILLNDHDPVPLYYQFAAQWPNAFTWEHLVKGPTEFRVKITKLKATVLTGEVTECCGGH